MNREAGTATTTDPGEQALRGNVLVAGVGNVLMSDDGFGVEVIRRLADQQLPADVEIVDIGIRGMHLAYQLLDGYRALLIVDATARGGKPGELYLLEHDLSGTPDPDAPPVGIPDDFEEHLKLMWDLQALAWQANEIRATLGRHGIADLDTAMDLRSTTALAVDYQRANILARTYQLSDLPDEHTMVTDLRRFIELYSLALAARRAGLTARAGELWAARPPEHPGATE